MIASQAHRQVGVGGNGAHCLPGVRHPGGLDGRKKKSVNDALSDFEFGDHRRAPPSCSDIYVNNYHEQM